MGNSIKWRGTEAEQHRERKKACLARRKQYGNDSCDERDGSCTECTYDMAVALRVTDEPRADLSSLPAMKGEG